MGSSDRVIQKYIWLVNTILQAKGITLKELNSLWLADTSTRMEAEGEFSERTFFRYKNAIRELFGIEIGCRHNNGNTYFIENAECLTKPSLYAWAYIGLATLPHLVGSEDLNERIVFEKSSGGLNHIPTIIEAIKENRIVIISFLPPNCYFPKEIRLEPYCVKQHLQDWYVIGTISETSTPFSLSLGNILTVDITDNIFIHDKWEEIKSNIDEIILQHPVQDVKDPHVSSIRYCSEAHLPKLSYEGVTK